MSTRRTFLVGALATGSAMAWLPGCVDEGGGEDGLTNAARREVEGSDVALWQRLARERVAQANAHDLDALTRSYARDAELVVNGVRLTGAAMGQQLAQLGLGSSGGGLANARLTTDAEFITETEIIHRGRLNGRHVAAMFGFPPTERDVTIVFAAFRRFSRDQRLVSERLTLNLGVLDPDLILLPSA